MTETLPDANDLARTVMLTRRVRHGNPRRAWENVGAPGDRGNGLPRRLAPQFRADRKAGPTVSIVPAQNRSDVRPADDPTAARA